MNEKIAVLVTGPESTGTTYVAEVFAALGFVGDKYDPQTMLIRLEEGKVLGEDMVVIRQSVPHERKWPALGNMMNMLLKRSYRCIAVILVRDPWCVVRSHCAAHQHSESPEMSFSLVQSAYQHIFRELSWARVDFALLPYEALKIRGWEMRLCSLLGLDVRQASVPEFKDGNEKWYR